MADKNDVPAMTDTTNSDTKNIRQLQEELQVSYHDFASYLGQMDQASFDRIPVPGKWTAGQHLDHLIRSVQPLVWIFGLPAFVFPVAFGKSNRQGRTYEQLVQRYHDKLALGGRARGRFIPRVLPFTNKDQGFRQLDRLVGKLCRKLDAFGEEKLDLLILPHPLLGKLTLREMMYFTIYHAKHHQQLVEKYASIPSQP